MPEKKKDEIIDAGAVHLDEEELDEAHAAGYSTGPTAMKIPNLFSGSSGINDPNLPIKDLGTNVGNLTDKPKGSK